MKLVTLNAWGGRLAGPLLEFIKGNAGDADIFCLQEVFSSPENFPIALNAKANLHQEITRILRDYRDYHSPKSKGYDYGGYLGKELDFGNAIFIKKEIPVISCDELFDVVSVAGYDWRENAIAKAQFMKIGSLEDSFVVCNYHGVWIKNTFKKDVPQRIEQARHIKNMLDAFPGEKILCGDFNLVPDGESIKILESGMRNLITDHKITSTRSSIYKKNETKYGDYVLVSPGLRVNEFKVLPDEISDHLALELDFEIVHK